MIGSEFYLLADIVGEEDFFDFGGHPLGIEILCQGGQFVDTVRWKRVSGQRRNSRSCNDIAQNKTEMKLTWINITVGNKII